MRNRTVNLKDKGVTTASQVVSFINYCKLSEVPTDP